MKTSTFRIAGIFCAGILAQGAQADARVPVLEPGMHPATPSYESIFPASIVPLDTDIPWKRRFLGNESFNAEHTLPPTSPALEQSSIKSSSGTSTLSSGELNSDEFDATGIVQLVKSSEGKIKIRHGPIERLGMPAMTMMFHIEDSSQLAGLQKGAEIAFRVNNTAAGFSITRLEALGRDASDSLDARGTIRSIRALQGKIKIEHGPIDKFGMPAMTMVFKVKDPKIMDKLGRGMQIEFDVINGPGGFEITQIRAVEE